MDRDEMRAWIREHRVCTLEIELDIAVLHRGPTFSEVDPSDRLTATEIQEALRGLGARPRTWRAVEDLNAAR